MPTFVPAPNCAEVTVNGEQAGIPCQFGIGFEFTSDPSLTDLDDLLALIIPWLSSDLATLMNPVAHITSVEAKVLTTDEGFIKDIEVDIAGTAEGDPLPAQVSVCLTKDTGLAGRSRRGRLYTWGVDSSFVTTVRTLGVVGIGLYNAAFANLLVDVDGSGWVPVVISTISDGVPRVSALITPIFQIVCRDARLDTQRRRLGRSI